jgi:hypothetical protein
MWEIACKRGNLQTNLHDLITSLRFFPRLASVCRIAAINSPSTHSAPEINLDGLHLHFLALSHGVLLLLIGANQLLLDLLQMLLKVTSQSAVFYK